jgi:hypothetical protein
LTEFSDAGHSFLVVRKTSHNLNLNVLTASCCSSKSNPFLSIIHSWAATQEIIIDRIRIFIPFSLCKSTNLIQLHNTTDSFFRSGMQTWFSLIFCLLLHVFVKEGGSTLSAIVPIMMLSHEASNPGNGRVLPQPDNLSSILDPVVLEGLERNGLVDTLRLLWLGVDLLLPLLSSSTKTEDKVKSGLLLNVIVRKGTAILKLLSGEDETLLVRGDSLLVLDLGLDVVNGVRRLDIERDGLT